MRRLTAFVCFIFCCGLLLGSSLSGSVVAQAYESPHGPYANFPAGCAACHVAHAAIGPNLMLKTNITALCLTCHDGTASVFNVVYVPELDIYGTGVTRAVYGFGFGTTSGAVYFHPVRDTGNSLVGQVLECVDCHNPHGDMSVPGQVYPRLLNSFDGTTRYYQGPNFCLACHGSVDRGFPSVEDPTVSYWVYTLGNHKNSFAAHYNTSKAALQPPSGTLVTCATCHYKHASDLRCLLAGQEENLCFKCHNTTANSMSGRNIQAEFQKASHHDIFGTTGAKVECSSCHGPHTVGAATLTNATATYSQVSNPHNTKSVMGRVYALQDNGIGNTVGTFTDFCLACHDNRPPTKTASTTVFVPYDIAFPPVTRIDFTTNSSGWRKTNYPTSAHGTKPLLCTDCHNSHGSDYPLLQKYPEDTQTADGECLWCHKAGNTWGAPDIRTAISTANASYHPTLVYSGRHSDTEPLRNVGLSNRHAECADCHDVHQATSGTTAAPAAQSAIRGVYGVTPAWGTTAWTTASYTYKNPIDYEYELCFKCHSPFSYGTTPPNPTPSSTTQVTGGFAQTDLTKEFNPNNPSYHAVVSGSQIPTFTDSQGATHYYGKFVAPWTATSRLYCADCHTTSLAAGKGPHGSGYGFILPKPWNPITSGGYYGTGSYYAGDTSGHLCFSCHDYAFYSNDVAGGGGGSDTVRSAFSYPTLTQSKKGVTVYAGSAESYNYHSVHHNLGCASCHAAIPHGYFRRGLLVLPTDASPYDLGAQINKSSLTPPAPGQWYCNYCH
ncbi:cytochrome c3 family protein [Thermodesulfitimonas autotrophica]|uniref:cytochrome c3 family protein n=1 Tax=Thermodesulfitimonas autotrophica TaxID=1894989 RepID=UPI002FE02B5A